MTKYEKTALKVLGQREMLYKLQCKITQRFIEHTLPIKQIELQRFMVELLQDLARLDKELSVRSNLSAKDLAEYDRYNTLFEQYKVGYDKTMQAVQQSFDFGTLEVIDYD